MKIRSGFLRILVPLFCLPGMISCHTGKPAVDPAPTNNHGKPVPVSGSDMKSMEEAKEKM